MVNIDRLAQFYKWRLYTSKELHTFVEKNLLSEEDYIKIVGDGEGT